MSIFEVIMLLCFGAAWPVSGIKDPYYRVNKMGSVIDPCADIVKDANHNLYCWGQQKRNPIDGGFLKQIGFNRHQDV